MIFICIRNIDNIGHIMCYLTGWGFYYCTHIGRQSVLGTDAEGLGKHCLYTHAFQQALL